MAKLLAIETATKICSVALFEDSKLLGFKEQAGDYSHAENLAPFTNQLLNECDVHIKELAAIAVSKGPGSYTGLRIGVSFAKGLCYSLKIPLIAIDTLISIAWAKKDLLKTDELVCAMIDARRMEVYAEIYDANLKTLKKVSADIIDENSYSSFLEKSKVYFIGDGANKCKETLTHKNAIFEDSFQASAIYMGELAYKKLDNNTFEDVAYFEPFYLKDFVALKGKKLV